MSEREIATKVGKVGWSEHRFHGYAVFGELVGRASITSLLSLSVTGRIPDKETLAVLDEISATQTLADPRIYPLKVTRLASSFGHPILAWCLGSLAQEGALIGGDVLRDTAKWISWYTAARKSGELPGPLVQTLTAGAKFLSGFGIPVRPVDERVECLKKRMKEVGRDDLPHWRSLMEVADAVADRPRMVPNMVGAGAALLLDCGYSPAEAANLAPLLHHHTFVANAVEGATQRSAILRRLPRDCVAYEGPPPRKSPRALAAEGSTAPTASKSG